MKCSDFDKLVVRRQYRSKITAKDREIAGIDTETIDGRAFILCDHLGNVLYPESFLDCLKFLTARRFEGKINLFFNIRYDCLAILKWTGDRRLYWSLHVNKKFRYKGFMVIYYDKKFLTIKKGKKVFTFYDLAQFFGCSLEEASSRYLGKHKKKMDVEHFEKYTKRKIEEYCITDAVRCYELGCLLKQAMKRSGVYHHRWISKANIAEKFFRSRCYIPTLRDIPTDVLRYAYLSYRGGWIECFRRGFFAQAYQYDIKSAYPAHIRNLISYKYGEWIKRKRVPKGAIRGFVKCRITLDDRVHPISYRYDDRISLNPVGEWTDWITLNEYNYINGELGLHSWAKIIDGWFFVPTKIVHPFRSEIDKLFKLKEEATTDMERLLFKIMLNSLYGKFIEVNRRRGKWITSNLFNPMYASEITANTRLQLSSLLDDSVILVAQDAFITTKRREFKGNGIGSIALQDQGECIVMGCGVYEMNGKVKNRGFRSKLNLRELLDRDEIAITYIEKRPITLAQALFFREKYQLDDLNCFIPEKRIRDVNFDVKRWWTPFESARQVLSEQRESEPIRLSLLELFS